MIEKGNHIKRKWPEIRVFYVLIFLQLIVLNSVYPIELDIENYLGLNYITNYTPEEYKHQPQNWCILQDKRGLIYVANQGGLLEYDGVSWRKIEVPNNSIRSLAIDDSGIIYVGGLNEIGFLKPDSNGALCYHSLVNKLEDQQKNFFNVWRIHALKEGIYFMTWKYLFRWNPNSRQFKIWETGKNRYFRASFVCQDKLYLRQENTGLVQMKNDILQILPGSEQFGIVKIYMMVTLKNRKLLVFTRNNGIHSYNNETQNFSQFPPNGLTNYLKKKELYYGIQLSNSDYALATGNGGLVIINSQLKMKKVFTKASGIQNDSVKNVFEDTEGNLWLALEKGISKIEYASSISIYDDNRSDLPGLVLAVTQQSQKDKLYVGTTRGMYYLDQRTSTKFRQIPEVFGNCFSLTSIGETVLAATQSGVYQVENDTISQQITKIPSLVLYPSEKNPERVWVGTVSGLFSLIQNKNHHFSEERQLIKEEPIRTIVEEVNGTLWVGTDVKGVIKIDFSKPGDMNSAVITRYDKANGLPEGAVRVFKAANHVMFATNTLLFRFKNKSQTFIPDQTLGIQFNKKYKGVFRLAEDHKKNIWFHCQNRNIQAIPQMNGTYILNEKPFLRIPPSGVNSIYPSPNGETVWYASNDGLIRYDITQKNQHLQPFSTIIRKVVVNGLIVFNGFKTEIINEPNYPIIPYKHRNLRFEFSAPFFEAGQENQYQYLLEGYDVQWSTWSKEPQIAYTNLDGGNYIFRVRGKNVYENIGEEAVFKFKILPPWYKTWWAFIIYITFIFIVVFFIVKWRSWKLIQEKQRLEHIVEERTLEINNKNHQLEEQSEKLKEMDKVKSRFFANISHEFRTPLTLIMGPLEQMLSGKREKDEIKKLKLMLRNSQRLLNLINQLLDLSKFDSGKMRLQAENRNIIPFIKGIVLSFELAANQHEVDLTFQSSVNTLIIYFDPEKLEHIMCNLLINAIKFTPQGGKITVSTMPPENGFFEISVRDTGSGIPREQLEYIFDRFFQVEETSRIHHLKGTGIGLAITKEMVNLHHGKIDVRSSTGNDSGTEFIIRLPIGTNHLKPEEISEINPVAQDLEKALLNRVPAALMLEDEEENEVNIVSTEKANQQDKDIILVIEDNHDVREYIRGTLESNYSVLEAKEGVEGLEKAKKIIPDLIISDVMMPGKDGYELSKQLKSDTLTSHIPIILLTAKASEDDMLTGLDSGADDYITKPFNTKILCARIKNLIDLRRQLQENLKREMTFQPIKSSISQVDREFLQDLHDIIEKNIGDTDFNVEQLAKKMYMSRATIYRKIMGLTGETPTDYIRAYRLKRGAELLKSNFGTILEIALEVGFSSSAYFTKCFKDKFHQLPSEYTKE